MSDSETNKVKQTLESSLQGERLGLRTGRTVLEIEAMEMQALNFWFFCFKTKELLFVSFWQQKEKNINKLLPCVAHKNEYDY